ncbi:MAG TPA: spore germination protein GerW family protein [Candidatus Dormibacteraeota bacterium]|nr:spore germination protein GerW family protein [Candidatus Dormibacteraeota bacterium]
MEANEILEKARDTLTVRRVFGDPIEREGTMVVPVARVRGGAGAGEGEGKMPEGETERVGTGRGGGWGADAKPVGVYVIKDGDVRWRPAVDVNRVVLGGQVALVVAMLVLRSIVRNRRRR